MRKEIVQNLQYGSGVGCRQHSMNSVVSRHSLIRLRRQVNELGKKDTLDLSSASRILFQPTDNFGIKTFRAELDGHWLLFTNDKGRSYIYKFDEKCPYGVHELKLIVTDIAGNITTKNWWFRRGPNTHPKKVKSKKHGGSTKKKLGKKRK